MEAKTAADLYRRMTHQFERVIASTELLNDLFDKMQMLSVRIVKQRAKWHVQPWSETLPHVRIPPNLFTESEQKQLLAASASHTSKPCKFPVKRLLVHLAHVLLIEAASTRSSSPYGTFVFACHVVSTLGFSTGHESIHRVYPKIKTAAALGAGWTNPRTPAYHFMLEWEEGEIEHTADNLWKGVFDKWVNT